MTQTSLKQLPQPSEDQCKAKLCYPSRSEKVEISYGSLCFPPSPSHICKKNFLRGAGEFKKVCLSVRLCVSATKSNNIWHIGGLATEFSGPAKLLASNFWAGDSDPGPSGRTPKMGVPAKSIYSGGFGAGGWCDTFTELGRWPKQNVGSGILSFGQRPKKTGPEGRAGQGTTKILEFQHFSLKGPP